MSKYALFAPADLATIREIAEVFSRVDPADVARLLDGETRDLFRQAHEALETALDERALDKVRIGALFAAIDLAPVLLSQVNELDERRRRDGYGHENEQRVP